MRKGQRPSRHFRKVRTRRGKRIVLVNERVNKSLRKARNKFPLMKSIDGKALIKREDMYDPFPEKLSIQESIARDILEDRQRKMDEMAESFKDAPRSAEDLKKKDDQFYEDIGVDKSERDFLNALSYSGVKTEELSKEDYASLLDFFKKNRKLELSLTKQTTNRALTSNDVLGVNVRALQKAAAEKKEVDALKHSVTMLEPLAKEAGMRNRFEDTKVDKLKGVFGKDSISGLESDTDETRRFFRLVEPKIKEIKAKVDIEREEIRKGVRADKDIVRVAVAKNALIANFLKEARSLPPGEQVKYFKKLNERQINPKKLGVVQEAFNESVSNKDILAKLAAGKEVPELKTVVASVKDELAKSNKGLTRGKFKYDPVALQKELQSEKNKGKPVYEVVTDYLINNNKMLIMKPKKKLKEDQRAIYDSLSPKQQKKMFPDTVEYSVPPMLNSKFRARVLSKLEGMFLNNNEKSLKKGSIPKSVGAKLSNKGLVFNEDVFKQEVKEHNKKTPGMFSGATLLFNHLKERNAISSSSTMDKLRQVPGLINKIKNPDVKNALTRDYNNLVIEASKIKEYSVLDEKSKDLRRELGGMSRNSKKRKFMESLDPGLVNSFNFYNIFNSAWGNRSSEQRKQRAIEKAQIMDAPLSFAKPKTLSQEQIDDLTATVKGNIPFTVSKKEAKQRYESAAAANVKAKTKKDIMLDELRQLAEGKKQISKLKNKKK